MRYMRCPSVAIYPDIGKLVTAYGVNCNTIENYIIGAVAPSIYNLGYINSSRLNNMPQHTRK